MPRTDELVIATAVEEVVSLDRRNRLLAALTRQAEQHHGLVAVRHALALGLTREQLRTLERANLADLIAPDVLRLAGAPRTREQCLMAAVLAAGDDSALSRTNASAHLRCSAPRNEATVHVSLPYGHSARVSKINLAPDDPLRSFVGITLHRTLRLDKVDVVVADGIPTTTAARTLIDLAGDVPNEELESMFDTARRLGLVSTAHLAQRVEALCGRGVKGSAEIRELVAAHRATKPAESRLEIKLWRLLRRYLPRFEIQPERQFVTRRADGEQARLDVAFAPIKYGVEAEGWEWHGGRLQWKRDKRRTASLEAGGWRLTFVTWDDVVHHPAETIERIVAAYTERAKLHER